jgi:gene 25-like lysozyme|nr:MAG TPA: baseplate assembly protein [Bacteriophage sp.]
MAKTQYYGIKFPIQIVSETGKCLDLNTTKADMVKSELMHVLFTPIGQRLRRPTFGTNLIQFLFNPNENETFSDVMLTLKQTVKKWIPDCSLEDIIIVETDDGLGLNAQIRYSVKEDDGSTSLYEIQTPL